MDKGELVMETITDRWEKWYERLGRIDPDNPEDNWVIRKTMRPYNYPKTAKLIAMQLKPNDSILEIGCGYGGLALEILKLVSVNYTAVEADEMLAQAEGTLQNKVHLVRAINIETLSEQQFDLFISHFCLWETPREYYEYILEKLIKNCRNISVIDHESKYIEGEIRKYFTITKELYYILSDGYKQFRYTGIRKERV